MRPNKYITFIKYSGFIDCECKTSHNIILNERRLTNAWCTLPWFKHNLFNHDRYTRINLFHNHVMGSQSAQFIPHQKTPTSLQVCVLCLNTLILFIMCIEVVIEYLYYNASIKTLLLILGALSVYPVVWVHYVRNS